MFAASLQFDIARGILAELRAAGYEAYLAGGCVRDLLLGREPKDYDVATSATPDVVLKMFKRTFGVGAHFGVVLVATRADGEDDDAVPEEKPDFILTEVATFRSDGAYSDGRHPDAVRYTESAEEDVRRRDFTINGLLLDPFRLRDSGPSTRSLRELAQDDSGGVDSDRGGSDGDAGPSTRSLRELAQDDSGGVDSDRGGSDGDAGPSTRPSLRSGLAQDDILMGESLRAAVLDFVGGLADLDAGVVRAIGLAELRFEEDRLRMLRGVRFAARFGYSLEERTRAAMRALASRIHSVSRERVRDELTKMLTEGRARRAFELLDETGLLQQVLPEIAKMKGVEQPPQFHPEGDVWTHTLMLLEQLEPGCEATLAWGALLHDVGKPATFRRAPDRIRFDGHVEVGVAIAAEICRRLRFSNEDTHQILALVENHMRFADAPRMKASTLKRFFRLEHFELHLALHRMDCLAAHRILENWEFVRERYEAMPEQTVRPQPLVTGRELIAAGYAPGPQFKEILHAVEDAQLEGVIATPEEAMEMVREKFGNRDQGSGIRD
jgi:poly(A) polymerase